MKEKFPMDNKSKKVYPKQGRRVLVAMSGGVDSSVAAALLKRQGYVVAGGYMKNFSPESWEGIISKDCPWEKDMEDVARVCKTLGIEWRSFNFEEEYCEKVIEYFFREYAAGRTPNPDVFCNSEIKFGIFLEKAMELGFDYIATGHYVRKVKSTSQNPKVLYKFFQAGDENKDQSYFLWNLNQYQLSKSLFPLGDYTKVKVRELAREFGLHNAGKKDSQGVCFVGHIKLKDFLSQRIPLKRGVIATTDGEKIGMHEGIYFYTIGQRQGIGLSGGPYYVVDKNAQTNILTVAKDPAQLEQKECNIHSVNWISGVEPMLPPKVFVKIRYQTQAVSATLYKLQDTGYKIIFDIPQRAIAPGQCAVLYLPSKTSAKEGEREEMLGGGIID